MKPWYQSLTLWGNALVIALFVLQYSLDQQWLPLWAEGLVVGVGNLLLRMKTGEQISIPFLRKPEAKS